MEDTTQVVGQENPTVENTAPVTEGSQAGDTTAQAPGVTGESVTPVAPQYTPNYKFTVHDKEHQFDEWVRPIIKDAETEKRVKELYEKAYGLDFVKPKYESKVKENEELYGKYGQLQSTVAEVMELKNAGQLDEFFQKLGLSNDKIYDWILGKINRNNMPPEQRKVYEDLEAKQRSESVLSKQMEQMNERYEQMASRAREMEVDFQLARPEVSDIKSRYDAANGDGAFKAFVAEQGVLHFNLHGQDTTVENALSMALKKLGDVWKGQPATPPTLPASGEKPLPVIPNVSGKNVSPTRKTPRSIDELKKIAAEMNG